MRKAVAYLIMLALLLSFSPVRAEEATWDCPECGTVGNTRNFCPECGAARPQVREPEPVKPLQAGDIVTFGKWEQDDNESNGAEPIEWIILGVQGSQALMTSRYGLVQCRYVYHCSGQTWENSLVRSILNGEFYDSAFTDAEKAAILETHVDESPSQHDPERPADADRFAPDTTDRVFILTYGEIMKYMPTPESRRCYATLYIRTHANHSVTRYENGQTCWYWLRNPVYRNNVGAVDWDGLIGASYMNNVYGVARPCCWVDLTLLMP